MLIGGGKGGRGGGRSAKSSAKKKHQQKHQQKKKKDGELEVILDTLPDAVAGPLTDALEKTSDTTKSATGKQQKPKKTLLRQISGLFSKEKTTAPLSQDSQKRFSLAGEIRIKLKKNNIELDKLQLLPKNILLGENVLKEILTQEELELLKEYIRIKNILYRYKYLKYKQKYLNLKSKINI